MKDLGQEKGVINDICKTLKIPPTPYSRISLVFSDTPQSGLSSNTPQLRAQISRPLLPAGGGEPGRANEAKASP
jgi:hypothetical protein